MDSKSIICRSKELPFHDCSSFTISQLYKSNKNKVLEKLTNNNFSINMIKHANSFSKAITLAIIMMKKALIT